MAAPIFPKIQRNDILEFQFSSWYPEFSSISIKSTIIRPLSHEFCNYLNADGIFVPEGSEDLPAESTLSDDEGDGEADESDKELDEDEIEQCFSFPELDIQIREAIKKYGAVFPKLNFSSPKDASWLLPASSPLKCTSPSDVYLLLKSSDFVTHDLSAETVFDNCDLADSENVPPYDLELVLRKWYPVDRSREFRCFIRDNSLLGISQRDPNYYDFMNDPATQEKITSAIDQFWNTNIKSKPKWERIGNYTFDILLTRDLSQGHILDFNPYAPRTDPLLFSYEELLELFRDDALAALTLRVIDSPAHPAASCKSPANQHNMIPFDALSLSDGRDIQEFADVWREGIAKSIIDDK